MARIGRVFLIPDLHAYDADERAVNLAAQLCEAFKPDTVIWLGDCLDAWWATQRFTRKAPELHGAAEREIALWHKYRKMFRASRVIVIPGNHDARILELRNSIEERHPELLNSDFLSLLDLKQILCPDGETYAESGEVGLAQGEFKATHGIYTGPTSGKREMLRHGTSGVSAHTHGLTRTYQRDSNYLRVWLQLGCLCKNPPRYRKLNDPSPRPDWMHAVGTVEIKGNQFHAEDIPFTLRYRAMLNGVRYRA